MSDEPDSRLLAVFAQAQQPLPSSEFIDAFLAKMQRARRIRTIRAVALIAISVIIAAFVMPAVLDDTASVMRAVAEHSRPYGALVISPWGWAVSMLIGFAVLLRAGALRRS